MNIFFLRSFFFLFSSKKDFFDTIFNFFHKKNPFLYIDRRIFVFQSIECKLWLD